MLDDFRDVVDRLDIPFRPVQVSSGDGEVFEGLALKHGNHNVLGLDHEEFILLLYPMDFDPSDARKLAQQDPEKQQRLFNLLRREMLEGRTGYQLNFDESEDPPELRRIAIEQKVIIDSDSPESRQRLLDGIQEIVVVALRAQTILQDAFDKRKASSTSAGFHQAMYS